MAITLMYITNNPCLAKIAQEAGVDRIWIDLETKGKEERQKGMNTVKSKHTIEDIYALRPIVTTSELMVRVNPIDDDSENEINEVINAGADYVMLPMFKSKQEVEKFLNLVNGRAKTMLLLETKEAEECLEEYVSLKGIDEIHIGLNDLHLAHKKSFMFELLTDGTVDKITKVLRERGVRFGFGGIARLGYGMLPAEYVITEHYRLGSQMAILSRSFCNSDKIEDYEQTSKLFSFELNKIREFEKNLLQYSNEQFEDNRVATERLVKNIIDKIGE